MLKPQGYDTATSGADLDEIRLHLRDELTPSTHDKKKFICPLCGSGTGRKRTAAFSIDRDGIHGKCFSCNFYGDIFDLEAQKEGIALSEATKNVVERYSSIDTGNAVQKKITPAYEQKSTHHDFSAFLNSCHSALKGSAGEEYLRSRGLNEQTMERFNLGYDASKKQITIPYNPRGTYYSARSIIPNAERPHDKPKGVESILFNGAALYQEQPCFVVESPLCAISVMQEGGSAIAISGLGGLNLLLSVIDNKRPSAPLILSLDNDPVNEQGNRPGVEAQEKLAEELAERGIIFEDINIAGDCKDPNELLQKDPESLRQNVLASIKAAQIMAEAVKQNELEDYEAQSVSASFADFEEFLKTSSDRAPTSTGFSELDKILNGGLNAGLYIMGAISSLGKTSWMLNLADNISAAGRDVLYFSLEMSRNELIAKSISRYSFQIVGEQSLNMGEAFNTFEVLNVNGEKLQKSSVLREAMKRYRDTAGKHMWIFEGVGDFGVSEIRQRVDEHIRITSRTPVVFVDYLQILAPEDPHFTDKQNTDKAVVELKRMSVAYGMPIFCISSLNRSNYKEPINMAAFKESGAIEYGSDVLIGVQIYGIDRQQGETKQAYGKRVNELINKAEQSPQVDIEMKILKNRNGRRNSTRFLFDKAYNTFHEIPVGFTSAYVETPFDDDEEEDDSVI